TCKVVKFEKDRDIRSELDHLGMPIAVDAWVNNFHLITVPFISLQNVKNIATETDGYQPHLLL
ncbi:hypothetical protein Tco_0387657, partial [Tanacetum coccineum]